MANTLPYKTITREKFLFPEMRMTAKLMKQSFTDKEIVKEISDNNLFQFPTERMIGNIATVCIKRLRSLESDELVELIAEGTSSTAKQVCLYAMMCSNRLVWEFMVSVIADKFKTKDFFFSHRDLNSFFTRLQEQEDIVASWSESTIKRCKFELNKILVETEYLDSTKSEMLNPVLIDADFKNILIERKDYAGLTAFNCFEEV